MKTFNKITLLILIISVVVILQSFTVFVNADEADECKDCHQKEMIIHSFEESCLSCHNNDMTSLNITNTIISETEEINTNCIDCHNDKFKEVEVNDHGKPGLECQDCHKPHPTGSNPEILSWEETIPIEESTILCNTCHPVQYTSWKEKNHGDPDLDCTSCHDPHVELKQIKASTVSTPMLTNSLLMICIVGFLIFEVLTHKIIYRSSR